MFNSTGKPLLVSQTSLATQHPPGTLKPSEKIKVDMVKQYSQTGRDFTGKSGIATNALQS